MLQDRHEQPGQGEPRTEEVQRRDLPDEVLDEEERRPPHGRDGHEGEGRQGDAVTAGHQGTSEGRAGGPLRVTRNR